MSNKSALLGAITLPREAVDVPELGETFTVQGMSGAARDAFESSLLITSANGKKRTISTANLRAKLLARSLIDPETGQLLFTDTDVDALGAVRADVLDRLFSVAQRLSGLSDKDVEALEKK